MPLNKSLLGTLREMVQSEGPPDGSEISLVVPQGETWKILSCSFRLATSISVGTRLVHLVVLKESDERLVMVAESTQGISTEKKYSAALYTKNDWGSKGDDISIGLIHELWLTAGDALVTETENLQSNDVFTPLIASIERHYNRV